ncbi:hypothetical protein F5Y17DRAFT_45801 [Xylariaceae sp. FL0594]|nr:hypothetical protein F5Y17DRAFT_45801 [Xylariaceae sp. FL0594]
MSLGLPRLFCSFLDEASAFGGVVRVSAQCTVVVLLSFSRRPLLLYLTEVYVPQCTAVCCTALTLNFYRVRAWCHFPLLVCLADFNLSGAAYRIHKSVQLPYTAGLMCSNYLSGYLSFACRLHKYALSFLPLPDYLVLHCLLMTDSLHAPSRDRARPSHRLATYCKRNHNQACGQTKANQPAPSRIFPPTCNTMYVQPRRRCKEDSR